MRNLLSLLAIVLFVTACKKEKPQVPTAGYPDTWGMYGTNGDDSFKATSLNAALIYYSNTNRYEFNVGGWNRITDEDIELRYSCASFQPGVYSLDSVRTSERHKTWGCYITTDKFNYGDGYIYIYSHADSIVKGGYDFTISGKKHIKGIFTIKPLYDTEVE